MPTQGERIVALEISNSEHQRRLDGINGQIEGVRAEQAQTNTHFAEFRAEMRAKIAIYAAVGSTVGGIIVALIAGLILHYLTGHHFTNDLQAK